MRLYSIDITLKLGESLLWYSVTALRLDITSKKKKSMASDNGGSIIINVHVWHDWWPPELDHP